METKCYLFHGEWFLDIKLITKHLRDNNMIAYVYQSCDEGYIV